MSKRAKKPSQRKVEVFRSLEVLEAPIPGLQTRGTVRVHGWWQRTTFSMLKKGDIFRLWDRSENGEFVPDQKAKGEHVVQVALEDAKQMEAPTIGAVQCLPVKGFKRRR